MSARTVRTCTDWLRLDPLQAPYIAFSHRPHCCGLCGTLITGDGHDANLLEIACLPARDDDAYHRKVKIEPGAYAGEYLTVQSSDGRYGIRFEADKNKIAQYYAGRFSAVQYVEGCE